MKWVGLVLFHCNASETEGVAGCMPLARKCPSVQYSQCFLLSGEPPSRSPNDEGL